MIALRLLPCQRCGVPLTASLVISFIARCWRVVVLTLVGVNGVAYANGSEDDWATTVSRVADSVVSLQLSHLRNFDDVEQGNSNATGFIVDAEQGIILTNRHVVGAGPIRVTATFQNQERVDAVPLYRDPIHDFAFVRYDPKALKYASPSSLPLRPEKVRTGMNIRVIGSDGGEQLSILPGTIARLDREVPSYGRYGYNDFNTFYLQAASGTSGGSSGSPVIDIDGDVVALNAAANTKTASSFFLPLPRIQHALAKLQQQEHVERGGFQTLFVLAPFRELERLGLDSDTENRARQLGSGVNGMLTVSQVLPEGVADGKFEPGDILVSINGQLITDFVSLEDLLDQYIGQTMKVDVIRQGLALSVDVDVADLHAISPQQLLELGDAIVQDMSIQHSRAMNLPQRGVVVMRAGYMFTRAAVPPGSLIVKVNGKKIDNINTFIDVLKASTGTKKQRVRYIVPGREFSSELAQVELDDRWFTNRLCSRVDDAQFWDCQAVQLEGYEQADLAGLDTTPQFENPVLQAIAPAMVRVDFSIPYAIDNVYARHFNGVGLIVDRDRGLVAVDRNTVPVGLGDVEITFFGSLVIPGDVVFLHPKHNLAFVQFDVEALGSLAIGELALSEKSALTAEQLTKVGYRSDGTFRLHQIDDISRLTVGFKPPGLPRFQQSVVDLYGVPNVPPSLGGPIVDQDGVVRAVYMSFAFEEDREIKQREWALPASIILESLNSFRADVPYYSIDVNLSYQALAVARELGLPNEWLRRYYELPADVRRVLYVEQVVPETDAQSQLSTGDVIISIDGQLVSDLLSLEKLSQKEQVELTLLREGEIITRSLRPTLVDTLGTGRLVSWAGAGFQESFSAIGYQKAVAFPGVYITSTEQGSPALWDRLYRNRFVVAVDGVPIRHLDDFIREVTARKQGEVTRLTVVSMSGRKRIVAVAPEYNFWPTFELSRTSEGWQRISYSNE